MDLQLRPPYSNEAEEAVLSSMIFDESALKTAITLLSADDFYQPTNKATFEAAKQLHTDGMPVDTVTLKSRLIDNGVFEQIGGIKYLNEIAGSFYTSAHITHYANELLRLSDGRRVSGLVTGLLSKPDILTVEDLRQALNSAEQRQYIKSYLDKSANSIDAYVDSLYTEQKRIYTGFSGIDKVIGGLRVPSVAIIGAFPSVGKTAFALNISRKQDKRVVFFSLEMSNAMIYERLAASELQIDYGIFSGQRLTDENKQQIAEYVRTLKNQILCFDDAYCVEQHAQIIASIKPDLVVVDYIQKVRTTSKTDGRRHEIDYISGMYKQLARENDCCIILLSQLSRMERNSPTMANLKESGALEADGDLVAILHRPYVVDKNNPEIQESDAYLLIDKNKFGQTGKRELRFEGRFQQFYEIDSRVYSLDETTNDGCPFE